VPTPYPKEFSDDVIAVARKGDQSIAQVAKSFGISESCPHRWIHIAERDEARATGRVPARTTAASEPDLVPENNELRKLAKKLRPPRHVA
jgi:transposase-like protein